MIQRVELKIALRSLLANMRRTLLTLIITTIGLTSILFVAGYINQVRVGFAEILINEKYSHFQIYKKGFLELNNSSDMSRILSSEEIQSIENMLDRDEVDFILPRITVRGIADNYSDGVQQLFMGYGTEPYLENFMNYGKVVEGVKLSDTDSSAALLGIGLAKKLQVSLDDEIQIIVPNEGGGVEAAVVNVKGIADFGPDALNDVTMLVSLETAQSLFYTDSVQSILVKLFNTKDLDKVYGDFLGAAKNAGLDIETRTWKDMDKFYIQVMRDYTFQLNLVASILIFVILMAVSNTIYMSIMERTPEFGTLRAIGISKAEIIRTVVIEGFVLGLVAALLGIALSYGMQFFLRQVYIELPPPPSLTDPIRLSMVLRPKEVMSYSVFIVLTCSLATLFPSLKASSINIISAIRHA